MNIRTLTASEIECRVGSQDKSHEKPEWCTLLLYKDARCDYKMLDELFGPFGWQCSYESINGKLFCTISLWDEEKKQWVSKQNVGTESNTEATKGEASDAFKRAAFAVGVGRELYTAPHIYIRLNAKDVNGRYINAKFSVSKIDYNEKRQIVSLVIVDQNGNVRYTLGQTEQPKPADGDQLTAALAQIERANSTKELAAIYNKYPGLQPDSRFVNALSSRKKKVA